MNGSKLDANNYRPISRTSVPSKIMEFLIRDKIVEHPMAYDLISDYQHGLVPDRSCVTQLPDTLEEWTAWLDQEEKVDFVYVDFLRCWTPL